jgi:hypothetical protein
MHSVACAHIVPLGKKLQMLLQHEPAVGLANIKMNLKPHKFWKIYNFDKLEKLRQKDVSKTSLMAIIVYTCIYCSV